jgi:hypothetical protein
MKSEINKIRTSTLRGSVYDVHPHDKAQMATLCFYSWMSV